MDVYNALPAVVGKDVPAYFTHTEKKVDAKKAFENSLESKYVVHTVSDADKTIEDAKEDIASLTHDVENLEAGLKALDKSTAEATEQRKEDNSDFTELMAQDTAAKQILDSSENTLTTAIFCYLGCVGIDVGPVSSSFSSIVGCVGRGHCAS